MKNAAEKRPLTIAERSRRKRRRRRHGLRVGTVEYDEIRAPEVLVAAGILDRAKADDPAEIDAALTRVIETFIKTATRGGGR